MGVSGASGSSGGSRSSSSSSRSSSSNNSSNRSSSDNRSTSSNRSSSTNNSTRSGGISSTRDTQSSKQVDSKKSTDLSSRVELSKTDTFTAKADPNKGVPSISTATPEVKAKSTVPKEVISAKNLIASQPAVVPGKPVDAVPAATTKPAPGFTPRPGDTLSSIPDLDAALAKNLEAKNKPAVDASNVTNTQPTANPSTKPEVTSPDVPVLGGTMEAAHVSGTNPVNIRTDGSMTVKGKANLSSDLIGEKGVFQGQVNGNAFGGKISGGTFTNASLTGTHGPVQADGKVPVTLSIQAERGRELGAKANLGVASAEMGVSKGLRGNLTFSAKLSPDDVSALTKGNIPVPNPLDPSSLPVGSSLTARGEQFTGKEADLSYKGVGVMSDWEQAKGGAVRVERLDTDRVRVTMGPFNRSRNSIGVGIDAGKLSADFEVGKQLLGSQATSQEFNISTPQGRAAYDRFVTSGKLEPNTPGTSQYQSIKAITNQREIAATLNLGKVLGVQAHNMDGARIVERTTPNGKDYKYTADWNGQPTELTWTRDPNGGVKMGELRVPVNQQVASQFASRGTLRDIQRTLSAQGITDQTGQYNMSINEQAIKQMQEGYIQSERARAANQPYYSQELRDLAANPSVTNDAWRQAVASSIPKAYETNRNVPDFTPLERSLFQNTDPFSTARVLAERNMLGTTQEGLSGFLSKVALDNPNLRDNPNITFSPIF